MESLKHKQKRDEAQKGFEKILDFIDHNYPKGRPKKIQDALELIEKEVMEW